MHTSANTISVLGCGWLGLPLAERLLSLGYQVKGSTTTTEKMTALAEKGIQPFHISLTPGVNDDYDPVFFDSDTLILNFPPSRKQENVREFYPAQLDEVLRLAKVSTVKKILFVSSTSVYPNLNREVREADAGGDLSASGQALMEAEKLLQAEQHFGVSILRFCGLYDRERNPGRFLAGRRLKSNGKDKVNLIHREDCIGIIISMLEKQQWGEVFNACADEHPEKAQFYTLAAQKLGLEPPVFDSQAAEDFKIISSDKLKEKLKYVFVHPDPLRSVKESE